MDFQTLYPLLPKPPHTWSTHETTTWLNYISLPHLIPKFRNASIDGSCIYLLDSDILKEELGIQSTIVRKKIMNWVTFGFKNYEQFINSSTKMFQQIKVLEKAPLQLKKSITQSIRAEAKTHSSHSHLSSSVNNDQQYLTLQQFEGGNLGLHIVKNQPLTIGSHKNNQIYNLETSISQKHAIIGKRDEVNNGSYYIQDLGSKFGTYIKINQRMALKNGMIVQIGSYQFAVSSIDPQKQSLKLKLTNYNQIDSDSENLNSSNLTHIAKNQKNHHITLHIDLHSKSKYTFGRRKQNDFQKDDKHMSGMHCKITFINGRFYIEDYGSTNGTWMRISPEFTISKEIELFNQSIVKLGTAISYICRINNSVGNKNKEENGEMIDQNMCKFCKKLENNCLFLPCSHNISCMECCQKVGQFCPECKFQILQKIKIHK